MSNRTQKRYAKKMLEKNTKITSELYDKSFVIDSEKLDSIEKIQKAFELLKIKFTPPNEEAYNEYKDILSEYIEK